MKMLKYIVLVVSLIAGAQLLTSCVGYIETGPPPMRDEVIIVAPSPRYVWVPGYYTYSSGTYIWIEGSYRIPPRGKTSYIQGEWRKTPNGYKRGKGHWK